MFVKVAAVAPAVVRRDGKVRAGGHPADHALLGALEQKLDELAGPGVIDEIAAQATLVGKVKGKAVDDGRIGDPRYGLARAAGVLRGRQAGESHERRGRGEPAEVGYLGGEGVSAVSSAIPR